MDVCRFRRLRGTLHIHHLKRADFGEYKQQTGQHVGPNTRFSPVGLPIVLSSDSVRLFLHLQSFRRIRVGGLATAFQEGNCIGKTRNEFAHRETICIYVDTASASRRKVLVQAVRLVKRESKQLHRHLQPDMPQVVDRRHAVMRNFVDVKRKFRLHMLPLALGVIHYRTISRAKFGKFDGNREVDRLRMSNRVANVVRKRPHREGEFIRISRIAQQVHDEIPGAHVVGKVGVSDIAKRVISNVLDYAPAIRVGPRTLQVSGRQPRIVAQQQRNNGVMPCKVDQLLMRQQ